MRPKLETFIDVILLVLYQVNFYSVLSTLFPTSLLDNPPTTFKPLFLHLKLNNIFLNFILFWFKSKWDTAMSGKKLQEKYQRLCSGDWGTSLVWVHPDSCTQFWQKPGSAGTSNKDGTAECWGSGQSEPSLVVPLQIQMHSGPP